MKVMVAQICFERNEFSARRSSAKGESSSPTSRILLKGIRDPLRVRSNQDKNFFSQESEICAGRLGVGFCWVEYRKNRE